MNKYRGIIFDFNGVLWWDTYLQEETWSNTAIKLRQTPFSSEELLEKVHGRPSKIILEYLTQKNLTADEADQLTEEKEQVYRHKCLQEGEKFQLSPGAEDLLKFLVQNNIPRTIATGSKKLNVDFFVTHLKLDRYFDVNKIVYDDGFSRGKPFPDVYLKAVANLNLAPQDCVVVEDAHSGIVAAKRANIGLVYALGPKEHHAYLRTIPEADQIITTLAEIPKQLFTPDQPFYQR